jgi:ubiquinone biosynthesis protein Coq4
MIKTLHALNQFRKIRTAPESDRLKYVFGAVRAMGDKRVDKTRNRYLCDKRFCALLTAHPRLSDIISDTNSLEKMPEGSLGQRLFEYLQDDQVDYAKYLSEYKNAGLGKTAGELNYLYNARERDLHDIFHIVFDYERTRFGEMATIATQYWQGGSSGFGLIMFAGVIRYMFVRPRKSLWVLRALYNVWHRQRGTDLRVYPFEQNLEKPLWLVRKELGVKPKSYALKVVLKTASWKD